MTMKKWILFTTVTLWIISIPLIILGVDKYIEAKDNRLRNDFNRAIQSIFNGREYIDVVYSGRKVGFEKKAIPNKPTKRNIPQDEESIRLLGDLDKRALNRWKEDYGDLTKMYRIKNNQNEWEVPYEEEDGWELIKMSSSYDSDGNSLLVQQWIFPYAVGYKKQDYYFGYDYAPSVRTAVDEAFEFFTKDSKSHMIENYQKGACDRIFSKIYDCDNEYYTILRDSIPKFWQSGEPLWGEPWRYAKDEYSGRIISPMAYTYMHNGYYKVFVGLTQPTTWSIKRWDCAVDSDRSKLLKFWLISTSVLFAIIVLVLSISLFKKNKRANESDYHRLLRLSHPHNFMKPYDKDKVEKANCIYKEAEQINKDDVGKINSLIQKCIDELEISFIDSVSLEELKRLVNPERFMNPYDAEKVQIANDLFAILSKPDLTYAEYVEVKNKAVKL